MRVRIVYALSTETRPEYEKALAQVNTSKKLGGRLVDIRIEEVRPGQFAGVIVMEEPV
jgi:hypothetical protein